MSAPIVCRVIVITFLLSPFLAAQQSAEAQIAATLPTVVAARRVRRVPPEACREWRLQLREQL